MAVNQHEQTIVASHEDAIRVVPVHGYTDFAGPANDAPPPPARHLSYRGRTPCGASSGAWARRGGH